MQITKNVTALAASLELLRNMNFANRQTFKENEKRSNDFSVLKNVDLPFKNADSVFEFSVFSVFIVFFFRNWFHVNYLNKITYMVSQTKMYA